MSNQGLREKAANIHKKGKLARSIRITIGTLFVVLVIAYNILFTPAVLEKVIRSQFELHTNGKISLHILQSSFFRGFKFENIEILSGPDFSYRPILKIDRLNIVYSVYGFFAGDFGFHEFGLYNPQVFLYHKDNVWNVSTLAKKSEKQNDKAPEKQEQRKSGISIPVPIRGFIKFIIQNFSLSIIDLNENGNDSLEAGLKNFTLKTYIITHKFKSIPLNVNAIDIIKTVIVNLDPQKTVDIYFKNNSARLKSPLDFHWLLSFDEKLEKEGFFSRLVIGHSEIPVEYKGRHLLPLNFGMDYDIDYNPNANQIRLKFFRITFLENTWFNFTGLIDRPDDTDKMRLNLSVNKSNIDIGKILPFYRAFTDKRDIDFSGEISFAPTNIMGTLNDLHLDGKINLYKLNILMREKNLNFDYLDLYYKANIDKNLEKSFIPKVRSANFKWSGVFNESALGAEFEYNLENKLNLFAYIKQFNPEPFVSEKVSGLFNMEFRVKGKNEKNLKSTLSINSPGFTYYIGRGLSGLNQLNLFLQTNVIFDEGSYSSMNVSAPEINLQINNHKNRRALSLNASLEMKRSPLEMDVSFKIDRFATILQNLKPTLPYTYREKIESFGQNFEKEIRLSGITSYVQKGSQIEGTADSRIFVDDLDINDIVFKSKIVKEDDVIRIPEMILTGLNDALDAGVKGVLYHEYQKSNDYSQNGNSRESIQVWMPDLTYRFKLGKTEKTKIFKSNTLAGSFDLKGFAKNYIVDGKLIIDKLFYDNGNFTRINNVNMDFPFRHDRRLKKILNLTVADKERLIGNFGKEFQYNFTVDSVEIPNPTRLKEPLKIIYPKNNYSGLSASMRYKDNVFEMPTMQIFMLNGLVSVQDMIFNVGRAKLSDMEYRALIQVKDIDLKQLIPAEKAVTIKDGKISADALLSASDFENLLSNTSGYISVYKIGKQFARQGVRVVMPDTSPLINFLVDESYNVRKFDFEIKEGLAYAKILYTKGILGSILPIGLQGNQIVQERRPLTELLQKAGDEVKIYQTERISDTDTERNL